MRQIVSLLLALCFSLFLSACGGGGGSTTPADPSQLTYTGLTTQAAVDADNAERLAIGAYFGDQSGKVVNPLAVATAHGGDTTLPVRSLSRLLRRTLRHEVPTPGATQAARLAAAREAAFTYPGPCGGQLLSNPLWAEPGSFTDTLEYQDYCEDGRTLNGKISVIGSLDPASGFLSGFTMTFHSLAIQESNTAYTMDGQVRIDYGGPQYAETVAMSFLLRHDASSEVFRFENYFIGINYGPDYTEETVSGRYFDPAFGYVDLGTEQPLRVLSGLILPSAGALRCSGRYGTFVRMAFATWSSIHLEADTDGNGSSDWQKDLTPPPPDDTPSNHAPVADAGADRSAFQGDLVTLDGSGSVDPDGDRLTFQWSFASCPGVCPGLNNLATATPVFRPAAAGNYDLQLVVNDGQYSSAADTVQVTVAPAQPATPDALGQEWVYGRFGTYIGHSGLSVLDLEGDGDLEIVTAASPAGFGPNLFWYVLRRNGTGGYAQVFLSELSTVTINRILAADLDGDGIGEILVGYQDGRVEIFAGDTFARRLWVQAPGAVHALAAADLDGDGTAEIVTSDGQKIYVHDADGAPLWSTTAYGGYDLVIGNVDDDPAPEIVTTASGGHGYVVDAGTQALEWDYLNGFGARVRTGDIDGDGRDEIVGAASWYKITLFDAELKSPNREIAADLDIGTLLVTDLEGDGVAEILYGDNQWGSIHCYEGNGRTERWTITNPEHGTTGLAVGDVDADGTPEVLWGAGGSSTGPDFLFVASPAVGIEWQNVHLDGPLSAVAVGDVDDDGLDEIVMVSFESNSGYDDGIISIFDAVTNTLEWQSTDLPNIHAWSGVNGVRIADVDDDGETELVIATSNLYEGLVQVYNGRTHALERQSAGTSSEPFTTLEVADVDGDGDTEIVVGTNVATTGAFGAHLIVLNGKTLAEEWKSPSLLDGWATVSDIDIADVDGDGRQEMLVAVGGSRVYAIDGVTHQIDWLEALPASTVGAFDLDADGGKEILVGQIDGMIGVYDGTTFALRESVSALSGSAVAALTLADLDGDNSPEWILASNGMLSVLENGTGKLLWRSKNLGANLGRYDQLAVRNIDGDGKKEIVVGSDFALYQFD